MNIQSWAQRAIGQAATQRKIESLGIPRDKAHALLTRADVVPMALAQKDLSGAIKADEKQNMAAAIGVPLGVLFLMFVIVIVGSSPMMMNVMEEKQQRISEVLLGSVRPFELMMGKLLGGVGVALTLIAIYFAGAMWAAQRFHFAKYIEPRLLIWFVLFAVVAIFMYGALFVAVGSAVSNAREAQSLMTPIMMLIIVPMMALGPILQSPNGSIATALSFFPPSAPMASIVRMSIPPGAPPWQLIASLVLTALTAIVIVWCAGRIFRVGILMQGQGAKLGEMMKWVVSG
jgi:ABC-type Na+ efflux pump permease subunit